MEGLLSLLGFMQSHAINATRISKSNFCKDQSAALSVLHISVRHVMIASLTRQTEKRYFSLVVGSDLARAANLSLDRGSG